MEIKERNMQVLFGVFVNKLVFVGREKNGSNRKCLLKLLVRILIKYRTFVITELRDYCCYWKRDKES